MPKTLITTPNTQKKMRTFVEIGSCDFGTLNDFADHNWNGVIVEPIKKYLDKLPTKENVVYLNYAIDETSGSRIMNLVNEDLVSEDHDFAGMSSFHEVTNKPTYQEEVKTKTYQEMIQDSGIERIDYLKIDTEGHDWTILKNVVLDGPMRPNYIKVEHKHLDPYPMVNHLTHHGYKVFIDDTDILAISLSLISAATNP